MPLRIVGFFIVLCGLAVCYGAMQLWPPGLSSRTFTIIDVLRMGGACIVALMGVGNTVAGLVILLKRRARS
jgi:hypothetical protein